MSERSPQAGTFPEELSSAGVHLGQAKLLLMRSRRLIGTDDAREAITQITRSCDAAIRSLAELEKPQ